MPSKKDRWPELCKAVCKDDGLPTRIVGHWSEKKLFFWNRYIEITTSAMVGHPKWQAGLIYIDLFAGPGICTLRDSKIRIPGSPIIAATAPKPFDNIILCEKDPTLADACQSRISKTHAKNFCIVLKGDCNLLIKEVVKLIPERALTLAFIDPTGLDARFETIDTLSQSGRVDLLILFADAYDVVRNVDLYRQQSDSKLDQVLGPKSNWQEMWDTLENRCRGNIRRKFADIYKKQLKKHLGYIKFGDVTIKNGNTPLYTLIYASKHERGLDFWNKIANRDPSGQMDFDF
jgi:three-Cys-motif partner protein